MKLSDDVTLSKRIEKAALNAWPALHQMVYDGWMLRFSNGYTKRANSVNPLFESTIDVGEKIALCEAVYTAQGLRPTFRLTPFASPPNLDLVLEARGYQTLDRTLVMALDMETCRDLPAPPGSLRRESVETWMPLFCQLKGARLETHQTHQAILQAIPAETYPASRQDRTGRTVACGLGVLEGEFVGLFDLFTLPQARNQGHSTQLVLELLAWARRQKAHYAYLQVVEDNAPARRVYEDKIGFREIYRYWYRIPPDRT